VSGQLTTADYATISSVFPGINTFKACIMPGPQPSYLQVKPFIDDWTGHGCVIIIANYNYGAQYPINSGTFATDAATFAGIAVNTIDNPNVWFESENEAQNGGPPGSGQTVDDEHLNHYNAVRNLVQFTGTASGTHLTISNINSPASNPGASIVLGMTINPIANSSAVPLHTTIVSQTSGPAGGAGVYVTSNATTVSNAAMSAGNGNIIVLCANGGDPFYPPGTTMANQNTASYYTNMYNIIWDYHTYGTGNGVPSTGPNDTLNSSGDFFGNNLPNGIALFNAFVNSLDGQIPVGAFEWGDASLGANGPHNFTNDNEQIAVCKAICNAGVGNGRAGWAGQTAWLYGNYDGNFGGDVLQDGNAIFQQSDQFGVIVAFSIANPNTVNTNNYGFVGGPS
jgi:hypothetical protein